MPIGIRDVRIVQVGGHWEVSINGEFFCTTDSWMEAVNEIRETYGD